MCNCSGNTYNIGMGCCVPVVANANSYYTKSEIDEMIEEIEESGCCITSDEVDEKITTALVDYALKEEIPSLDGYATQTWVNEQGFLTTHQSLDGYATQTWVESQGYLTQHQDLSSYALKAEIPSLDGYATEQWVQNQGYLTAHQSLEGYVTENDLTAYTYDKDTIDEKISESGVFDPTQYYNKTATDNLLAAKADTATTYTKTEVDNLIPTIPTSNTAFTNDAGYLTEHQSIKTINGNSLVGSGNVQLDIPTIWYGTKAEYDNIETKDESTIYLIYES